MMGKAGTLWRESIRTSFKRTDQSKEREVKMRSGKIRLIAYHCLRIKGKFKTENLIERYSSPFLFSGISTISILYFQFLNS